MPKISSFQTVNPALTDKVLGTDADGSPSNATKNFTIEKIAEVTKNQILPQSTTQTPLLTDKLLASNESTPRTANRNFTIEGVRNVMMPETTAATPTLTDRIFAANPSDANPRLLNKTFTLSNVKTLLSEPTQLVLNTANFADQELTAASTKTAISFGSAISNSFVDLNTSGDIEILTAGNYLIRVALNCGAIQTSQGARHIDYYFIVESGGNGVPPSQAYPTVQNTVYFAGGDTDPAQTLIQEYPFFNAAANTIIDFYWSGSYYSSAANPSLFRTALVNRPTGTTGFNGVPSAAIQIIKVA